jgi:hypothetical protein
VYVSYGGLEREEKGIKVRDGVVDGHIETPVLNTLTPS